MSETKRIYEELSKLSQYKYTEVEYVPIQTMKLQINALDEFMMYLGYEDTYRTNYTSNGLYPSHDVISYNTAVKLYNTQDWILSRKGMYIPECTSNTGKLNSLFFKAKETRMAWASKTFKKLKIQWCKRKKEWVCHSDKLEMVQPEYYEQEFKWWVDRYNEKI